MIIEKVVGNLEKCSVVFVREMEEIANNDTPIDMNKKYRMSGRIIVWHFTKEEKNLDEQLRQGYRGKSIY